MSRKGGDQLRIQAAWRLQRMGRLAEAERIIRPALENATTPFNVAGAQMLAGRLAVERGELDQAERLLEEAWATVQRSGGFHLIGPTITALVLLEIRRGELGRARERAREGLGVVAGAQSGLIYNAELYWLAVCVEADLAERARAFRDHPAVGEHEHTAVAVVETLARIVTNVPGDGAPPESEAFLALAEAELLRLRGERATDPWNAAAERFCVIRAMYPCAYTTLRAAEALALAGSPLAETAVPLKAAHGAALEIGSPPFLQEVVGLARRAGVSLGEDEREQYRGVLSDIGLTDRELEVLRLLAEGRTNRQIGDELFITAKTASVHVSRILMKLGVANRAEAVAAAHRMGLARPLAVD
jgi:DNA-binding CsgD family transcriptional regulator